MDLRAVVEAGLEQLSKSQAPEPFVLDARGVCVVPVPLPPSVVKLQDQRLLVRVEVADSGAAVSFSTPLAVMKGAAGKEFYRALFYRQRHAGQVSGLSLALQPEDGRQELLLGIYHWLPTSPTPEAFVALFKRFTTGVFVLIEELKEMARRERAVQPLHQGRD